MQASPLGAKHITMTLEEYNQHLERISEQAYERAIMGAMFSSAGRLLGTIQNRIIQRGEATDGSKLKAYSTTSGYYTKEQFVKESAFKPQGKREVGNFINGKVRKSMFLQNGYKELRDIQGRPTDRTNLFYSGDTMRAYVIGRKENSIQLGFNNDMASKIRKGHEERYDKKIYSGSVSEINEYKEGVTDTYKEIIINVTNA